MSIRPYRDIVRRKSRRIMVGSVPVGGDRADHGADHDQHADRRCRGDHRADPPLRGGRRRHRPRFLPGRGLDRGPVGRSSSASKVPIVADIHFHYKRAIEAAEAGAACLRINPGNIGSAERVREVVKAAKDHGCSMRIGVNAGSLERDLLEKYGEPCPGGDGRERARSCPHPAGPRLPRVQDQREGVRRLPRGRRLSAARRCLRLPAAYRRHRGGRRCAAAR